MSSKGNYEAYQRTDIEHLIGLLDIDPEAKELYLIRARQVPDAERGRFVEQLRRLVLEQEPKEK